jgi:hypothetical protein
MKQKTCKNCRQLYTPQKMGQKVCCVECALSLAISERGKAEKVAKVKERREDKLKLKMRSDWMREAQAAFNSFIRARDVDQPCISCGRHHTGQYHAGHFLSVGARPELRFEESNVHKQCSACNNHLAGNIVLYRKALIEKIGLDGVEFLEGPHKAKKYVIEDLQQIKSYYASLTKELSAVE